MKADRFIAILLSRGWRILLCATVGLAAGIVYEATTPPTWDAGVVLMPGRIADVSETAGDLAMRVHSLPMRIEVARRLAIRDPNFVETWLQRNVIVEAQGSYVVLRVRGQSPESSRLIAQAYVDLLTTQYAAMQNSFAESLVRQSQQLAGSTDAGKPHGADDVRLSETASLLVGALAGVDRLSYRPLTVVTPVEASLAPANAGRMLVMLAGTMLGVVVGLIWVFG